MRFHLQDEFGCEGIYEATGEILNGILLVRLVKRVTPLADVASDLLALDLDDELASLVEGGPDAV